MTELRFQTDAEKLALATQWLNDILSDFGDCPVPPREEWDSESGLRGLRLHGLKETVNIALKEVTGTKWPYQKVEDAMRVIIDKYVKGPTWAGITEAEPEIDAMLFEAGWDDEEYHWECIRHNESKPHFCACWNVSPENGSKNPLPLT